ncbi:hypothetical protein ACSSS7_004278 [Eimeria intestinalis]
MSLGAGIAGTRTSRHIMQAQQQQYRLQQEHMGQQKETDTRWVEEQRREDFEQKARTQQKEHEQQQVGQRQQHQQSERRRRLAEETVAEEDPLRKSSTGSQQDRLASADATKDRKRRWRHPKRRQKHNQQHGLQEEPEGQPSEKLQKQPRHDRPDARTEAGPQLPEQCGNEHSQQDEQQLIFRRRWRTRERERWERKEERRLRRLDAQNPERLSLTSASQPLPHQQLLHEQQQVNPSPKVTQQRRQHWEEHSFTLVEAHEQPDFKRRFRLRRHHRRARSSKGEKPNTSQQQKQGSSLSEGLQQREQQEQQGQRKEFADGLPKETVSRRRHKWGRRHRRARSDKDKKTVPQERPQQDEHKIEEQHQKQTTEPESLHNQTERKRLEQQREEVHEHRGHEKEQNQVSQRVQRAGAASLQLSVLMTPLDAKARQLLSCDLGECAFSRNATSGGAAAATSAGAAATAALAPAGAVFVAVRDSKPKKTRDQTHADEPAQLTLDAQEADRQQEQNEDCEDVQKGRHHTFFASALEKLHNHRVPPSEGLPLLEQGGRQEQTATAAAAAPRKKCEAREEDILRANNSPPVKPKGSCQKHQAVPRGDFEVGVRKAASRGNEAKRQPMSPKQQPQQDAASAASPRCNVGRAWSSVFSAATSFFASLRLTSALPQWLTPSTR